MTWRWQLVRWVDRRFAAVHELALWSLLATGQWPESALDEPEPD